MLIIKKNLILAIFVRYLLKNIAVAIHMSKNEIREITSKMLDDNTVIGKPGWFTTYAVIGSGIISVITADER
jgi:hypothetical protein